MKTKIITDSTCDLPEDLLLEKDITTLPLHIAKREKSYLDGLEIRPKDIYDHVDAGGEICSTSAVNIHEFLQCLEVVSSQYKNREKSYTLIPKAFGHLRFFQRIGLNNYRGGVSL